MTRSVSPHSGFTLLELMVTLTIAAILLFVAVPGFLAFQRSSAVFSASSSFSSALNAARSEAIKRAKPALVVPLDPAGSNWAAGWTVFVDINNNGSFDAATDVLIVTQAAVPGGVSVPLTIAAPGFVDGSAAYVRYDGYGIPRSKPSPGSLPLPNAIDFTASAGSQVTTRRVILGVVGRPRTCDPVKDPTTCTLAVP